MINLTPEEKGEILKQHQEATKNFYLKKEEVKKGLQEPPKKEEPKKEEPKK